MVYGLRVITLIRPSVRMSACPLSLISKLYGYIRYMPIKHAHTQIHNWDSRARFSTHKYSWEVGLWGVLTVWLAAWIVGQHQQNELWETKAAGCKFVVACAHTHCEKGWIFKQASVLLLLHSPFRCLGFCVISTLTQFDSIPAVWSFIILDLEQHEVYEAPDRALVIHLHTLRLLSSCWQKLYKYTQSTWV